MRSMRSVRCEERSRQCRRMKIFPMGQDGGRSLEKAMPLRKTGREPGQSEIKGDTSRLLCVGTCRHRQSKRGRKTAPPDKYSDLLASEPASVAPSSAAAEKENDPDTAVVASAAIAAAAATAVMSAAAAAA